MDFFIFAFHSFVFHQCSELLYGDIHLVRINGKELPKTELFCRKLIFHFTSSYRIENPKIVIIHLGIVEKYAYLCNFVYLLFL